MNNLNGLTQPTVRWTRIPSRPSNGRSFLVTETESRLYDLLSKIGVISGGQIQAHQILHKSPKTTRRILSKLKAGRKIAEHILTVGGKDYKVYTLGPGGAEAIRVQYTPDYWFFYSPDEAIQRIMAFELYAKLSDYLSTEITVELAEEPYTYTFICRDKTYKVGIVWDNAVRFMELYRWNKPQERVILVCQDITQLDCLLVHLDEFTPIRAVTKDKLKEELVLYRPGVGKWILDVPNRQVKKPAKKAGQKIVHRKRMLL